MARTTLNLDADLLNSARHYAEARSLTLGKAVSELLRRGLTAPAPTKEVNGIRVFDLPPDSPTITSEDVRDIEAHDM